MRQDEKSERCKCEKNLMCLQWPKDVGKLQVSTKKKPLGRKSCPHMIASKVKETFNYIAEKKIRLCQQPECAWSLLVEKFPVKNLVCQGDSRRLEI